MTLLPFFGVAVRSSTNDGLRFAIISRESSDVALWLSSTTTTGRRYRKTCIRDKSDTCFKGLASLPNAFLKRNSCPFSSKTFRASFFLLSMRMDA